jgi:hypothetical protein
VEATYDVARRAYAARDAETALRMEPPIDAPDALRVLLDWLPDEQ